MDPYIRERVPSPSKPAALATSRLNYVVVVPVWGDHHTDLFLRFYVPFLLTDGNVGAFPHRSLEVDVVSRRVDFARMRQNADYRRLAELAQLKEIAIDDEIDLSVPHRAMTECYFKAIRGFEAPDDTVAIFPTPDCIMSRDALSRIVALMEVGWRGVMVCGLRITLEKAGPLLDKILATPHGAENLSERELAALVLNNLHPITLTCDVASEGFMVDWPSHVYWSAPDRNWLVAHCFHLHPLAVRGVPINYNVDTTIDGDYLVELGVNPDQYYVCQDSDELICVELSPAGKRIEATFGPFSQQSIVRFSVRCNPFHRYFYSRSILWRGADSFVIPESVARQMREVAEAVARGSKIEELRYAALNLVRRHPRFLRAAKWMRSMAGRARR